MARALTAAPVRARIAEAFCSASSTTTVGRFTLREDQREQLARIDAALDRFGGALLCDPPGSGKTIVALTVARRRGGALVLAPASLRQQWLRSAEAADTPITFSSLESVSRGARLPRAALLIVDEAHRLGNVGTARFARIAACAALAPVLLVTATPVVNRIADRDRLLSLFVGARSSVNADDVVIRRARDSIPLPPVRRLALLEIGAEVPGLADALRALPPPFPVADGRAASALARSSLAFAWRSSLAALAQALRRREVNGAAFATEIAAGRWPDRHTLKRWIIGDDAAQLTLGLSFENASGTPPADALPILERHLSGIRRLRAMVEPHVGIDSARRAASLIALLEQHAPSRAVCFSHHADTVRALWSVLRRTPGVVAITGERVSAAAGRWSREEILHALGPNSDTWRADDPRGVRLLLTTDLLAEGVELPGAEIVVHGDGAWTPARLEQRLGRARRPASRAREILLTGFRAPAGSAGILQLAKRLRAKRTARRNAMSSADARDALRAALDHWRVRDPISTSSPIDSPLVASIANARRAFLALLDGDQPILLAANESRGAWRLSCEPATQLDLVNRGDGREIPTDPAFALCAEKLISRWLSRRSARRTMGLSRRESSAALRALRRRLNLIVATSSLAERPSLAARVQRLTSAVTQAWTRGVDREIRMLLRGQMSGVPLLSAAEEASHQWIARRQNEPRKDARLVALLLFHPATKTTGPAPPPTPASPSPPSASP